ncbi:hypothetical protein ACE6H2_018352 [Prunus campanulata]
MSAGGASPPSKPCQETSLNNEKQDNEEAYEETIAKYGELVLSLPKERGWMTQHLVQYQGFWLSPVCAFEGALLLQQHFHARPSDIFLATFQKSGTTWLRALMFATMNRALHDVSSDQYPLLTTGPHDCFPFLDAYIHQTDSISHLNGRPILSHDASPDLFSTHMPYALLPKSVTASSSGCRFVYVCRNPKDVLVSKWIFMNKLRPKQLAPLSLQEAYDLFCQGVSHYGPFWDHVLGYWKASLEFRDKIFFLKYEDLKKDPFVHLKRLAEFLGQPFSLEEERKGVVQKIIKLCSFEHLSHLEVNKTKVQWFSSQLVVKNSYFFRKGQVGDWKNYFTDEMARRLDQITDDKFSASGLTFGPAAE